MRTPIMAGNWKMHKTAREAVEFVTRLQKELGDWEETEVVVAPPFVALAPVAERLQGTKIALAAQDCFWEEQGAYTGEVSPPMVRDVGCRYVIIGHSERRAYFGETNETVNKKVKAALAHGLHPIICVGESLEQRERGDTFTFVGRQVKECLQGLEEAAIQKMVIAYEPIWAIGTGKTATPEQAQEVHTFIRGVVAETFSPQGAEVLRIQYGGSVKPDNVDELMAQPDIDGALVGGASLVVESFARIVRFERR
ncbi:MAG: triose-phosphate isomerase [Deltaproteobacteria bacterium RBG_13_52_11]|nr:MAG: triose-phosphate isomerase [Deltaproteobacteria bacterium RBG_13_52_11]